jgi:hypothetical protein
MKTEFGESREYRQGECVSRGMKITLHRLALAVMMALAGASCSTAYDAYGRPRTVVEPGAALLGAAAVGLLAYGLASDNDHGHHHGHHRSYDRCYY